MNPKSYAYGIERAEDGAYGACLPDLPCGTTTAPTPEQFERQLPEAVELYLSDYRDRGQPPPRPQSRVGTVSAA